MTERLTVENLSFSYGARVALEDVSFTVGAGRFCALLGPNGAGKSTLFALLTRLFVAPRGRISVAGFPLASQPLQALARMGVVFQAPTLDLDLSVWRNLIYFAGLHGLSGRVAAARAEAALARLGMAERAGERVRALNGGHRRRLEVARALIPEPEVLLLDEPTVGLDAPTRRALTEHVHALAAQGIAVLWATHLVDEIEDDDDLLLLHRGRLLASGQAGALRGERPLADWFAEATA